MQAQDRGDLPAAQDGVDGAVCVGHPAAAFAEGQFVDQRIDGAVPAGGVDVAAVGATVERVGDAAAAGFAGEAVRVGAGVIAEMLGEGVGGGEGEARGEAAVQLHLGGLVDGVGAGVAAVDEAPVGEGAVGERTLGEEARRGLSLVEIGRPGQVGGLIGEVGDAEAHGVSDLPVDREAPLHHVRRPEVDLVGGAELEGAEVAAADTAGRAAGAGLREEEQRLAIRTDVAELADVALHGAGEREEDGAEQGHVVDAVAAADSGLVADAVGKTEAGQELGVVVLAEGFRQAGLFGGDERGAGHAADGSAGAGVDAEQGGRGDELDSLRVGHGDDAAGDRDSPVEVGDVEAGIGVAGLELVAEAEVERQAAGGAEGILHVGLVVGAATVVIGLDDGNAGLEGRGEEEVAKRVAREVTGESEVAVVVAGGEAEVAFGAELADGEAELEGVLAFDPGEVVDVLGVPADAAARAAFREARELLNVEVGQGVEEDVFLDVLEIKTVGEGASVEVEDGARLGKGDAAAELVE